MKTDTTKDRVVQQYLVSLRSSVSIYGMGAEFEIRHPSQVVESPELIEWICRRGTRSLCIV